jgi:hypothetical protein
MMDPIQLITYVIRPVLHDLRLWSENAERLLLGTACKESDCGRWIHQLEDGPALGIYQMEPATHDDIWMNFIANRPFLRDKKVLYNMDVNLLMGDFNYATAMCRVHYLRVLEPIPDTLDGQAHYWKTWYNSEKGKGTVDEYIAAWKRFVPAGNV